MKPTPAMPKIPPLTAVLMIVNLLAYLAQLATEPFVTQMGVLYGPLVAQGQYWRLLTSAFLHGSLIHIGFNLYMLFVLGRELESALGKVHYLIIYAGALFGSAATVMLFDWRQPTLGASGAVLGLAGAMGVVFYLRGVSLRNNPVTGLVVLNLALPLLIGGISFWGHFGGVAAGALMAVVMYWLPVAVLKGQRPNVVAIGLALVVGFIAIGVAAQILK